MFLPRFRKRLPVRGYTSTNMRNLSKGGCVALLRVVSDATLSSTTRYSRRQDRAREIIMAANPQSPNHMLAALPPADFEFIRPHLRSVELAHELVLARAGDAIPRVYFPHTGVISLVVSLSEGEMVEVAMIGRDGVFGASMVRDGAISVNDAMVQLPGTAYTLDLPHFRTAVEQSAFFRESLVNHEQAILIQVQQSAACNAYH